MSIFMNGSDNLLNGRACLSYHMISLGGHQAAMQCHPATLFLHTNEWLISFGDTAFKRFNSSTGNYSSADYLLLVLPILRLLQIC